MNPLSHDQIVQICMAARKAYDVWPMREEFELINSELSRTRCFEAWRHCEIGKITGGIQSLKLCTSEDHYLRLLAHFTAMRGEGGRAMMLLLRHSDEARITVYFKLMQSLEERGLQESYAATICRSKFKCDLGDASAKQLWSLVFDIRKRRKAARPAGEHYVKSKAGRLSSRPSGGNPF